jgi:tetratricopeptide (TPR) repeat protein
MLTSYIFTPHFIFLPHILYFYPTVYIFTPQFIFLPHSLYFSSILLLNYIFLPTRMKKSVGLLVTLSIATVVTYFVIKKIYKKDKSDYKTLKKEGDKYYDKKEYSLCILYYTKCLHMINDNLDILNRISYCYIKLKKYEEALTYLNKSLSISLKDNLDALKWRYECYRQCDKKKEYLKDLLLYEAIIKDDRLKKKSEDIIKSICDEETAKFIEEEGIKINKEEVLRGLISIKGVEEVFDELIKENVEESNNEIGKFDIEEESNSQVESSKGRLETNEGDYQVSVNSDPPSENKEVAGSEKKKKGSKNKNKSLLADKEDIKLLLRAIILVHKGRKDSSLEILKDSSYKYAVLFSEYLKSFSSTQPLSKSLPDDDVTSLYFLSKIYSNMKNKEDSLQCLMKILSYNLPLLQVDFIYADIILHYISIKDYKKVQEIIDSIKYSDSLLLVVLIGEYYLKKKEYDKVQDILSKEKSNDPKMLLFISLYYLTMNDKDTSLEVLRKSLKEYPSFYKSYLYLGNLLINDDMEESRDLFERSLEYCTCYEEVYVSKQALLLIEVHEYISQYGNK